MPVRRLWATIAATLSVTVAVALAGTAPASSASAAPRAAVPAATVVGTPPDNFSVLPGTYFSFPNRSTAERYNIRNRVLRTVNSVWGGYRDSLGEPRLGNGTIRMATWSFNDWTMAHALVDARNRGVTVQIMAASTANVDHAPWTWLKRQLGSYLYRPGHPETASSHSFARQCRGACRGSGGTPHSKFFLFDNVGAGHHRSIVVQSSMNLTTMAFNGQWNQAQVVWSPYSYSHFHGIFRQMRVGRPVVAPYRQYTSGNVTDMFFPRPGTTATTDPVMRTLSHVDCSGATSGGTGTHTKIRVINYAIYDTRGVWLAKRLRYLWSRGCDVAIIYALSTRPVIEILRNRSGRGPIPMKQSIITNSAGEIVKYNHSKWMTITGHWGTDTDARITVSGSANWSTAAFRDDEQMQMITRSPATAAASLANFSTTWYQSSSHAPGYGQRMAEGRVMANASAANGGLGYAPDNSIPFGTGAYRYLSEDE